MTRFLIDSLLSVSAIVWGAATRAGRYVPKSLGTGANFTQQTDFGMGFFA
jgi:hypothetical protein